MTDRLKMLMNGAGAAGGTGGATTGAASGVGATGNTGTSGATGSTSWYPDTEKSFIDAKGFPDAGALINSYKNLESMMGVPKERVLKLPEKADDPAWKEIHKRLGQPEKADGYQIQIPNAKPEEIQWMQGAFHELGLSKAQGEKFASKFAEHLTVQAQAQTKGAGEASNQQLTKLKEEWGQAYEKNTENANQIAQALGITKEQYQKYESVLGVDGWTKMLHGLTTKLGVKVGEPDFRGGSEGGGGNKFGVMSPAEAEARMIVLQGDTEWTKKYAAGNADAVEEYHHLNRMRYAQKT